MDSILPFRVGGTTKGHFHWGRANFETFYLPILSIKKKYLSYFKVISKIRSRYGPPRPGSDPSPLYSVIDSILLFDITVLTGFSI